MDKKLRFVVFLVLNKEPWFHDFQQKRNQTGDWGQIPLDGKISLIDMVCKKKLLAVPLVFG